jgi:hypothetical protein
MTDWALAAMKAGNLSLEGHCQAEGCKHFVVFDLERLIELAGPDYIVPEIIPGMVCTECGGDLKSTLAMTPPAGEDDALQ